MSTSVLHTRHGSPVVKVFFGMLLHSLSRPLLRPLFLPPLLHPVADAFTVVRKPVGVEQGVHKPGRPPTTNRLLPSLLSLGVSGLLPLLAVRDLLGLGDVRGDLASLPRLLVFLFVLPAAATVRRLLRLFLLLRLFAALVMTAFLGLFGLKKK